MSDPGNPQVITAPRIMTGLFCNTSDQLEFVADNGHMSNAAFNLAMQEVNAKKAECVLHTNSQVLISSMKFVKQDKIGDGNTVWMYEATAVGFVFGGIPTKIDPPAILFVYVIRPLDPSHKENGA